MPTPIRCPALALPDIPYLHKILELLLMYFVSLSQPHSPSSILEHSRSLEFEHEV